MSIRIRVRAVVLMVALVITGVGGFVILASRPVEAAKCCWVMVCSPYGCWEECRTCPKFP